MSSCVGLSSLRLNHETHCKNWALIISLNAKAICKMIQELLKLQIVTFLEQISAGACSDGFQNHFWIMKSAVILDLT